jgi:serine/threonine protein kinase
LTPLIAAKRCWQAKDPCRDSSSQRAARFESSVDYPQQLRLPPAESMLFSPRQQTQTLSTGTPVENLDGKQLGPYRVIEALGEGGMAAVYRAYQPGMDRNVALKILPRQYADDPSFVLRFTHEARVIANLEHRNILPVYDFGESDGYTYLAMRFVDSGTLADLIGHGQLAMSQIRKVITEVAEALDYAHLRGVLHRDIKPSNILIDRTGNCLLADFGLAKMVEGNIHLTQTGSVLGTPAYMSPEQALGQPLDGRTDIYALGVILYRMCTGRLPFIAETPAAVLIKHIQDPLPPPRLHNPNLPEAVERIILKSLAKRQEDRYATAGALAAAFREAVPESEGIAIAPTRRIQPVRPILQPRAGEAERMKEQKARQEEEISKTTDQMSQLRRIRSRRGWSIFLIVVASVFWVECIVGISMYLFGQADSQPKWGWLSLFLFLVSFIGYGGVLLYKASRKMEAALRAQAAKEGNFFCCQCGKPMTAYYWGHLVACILLPGSGLVSLLFKLKKCTKCKRRYPERILALR